MAETVELTFESSGLLTTIQDQGRTGYSHLGVPSGGALDKAAARLANTLAGNDPGTPVLEITIQGPKVRFDGGPCIISITGADISPSLDQIPARLNAPLRVAPGQLLSFGKLRSGCRAYVAVSGTWQVDSWLGSSSAFLQDPTNILSKQLISKGQKLTISAPAGKIATPPAGISDVKGGLKPNQKVRVIPGPEYHQFSRQAIECFLKREHIASNDCSRMGIRIEAPLDGVHIEHGLISSAVVPGTVQVTQSGHCVLLLGDAQTTGGYHRIANVISADMDTLAQIKPGDSLRFDLLNIDQIRNI